MERKGLCHSAVLELSILIDWLHPSWAWESAGEFICLCHSQEAIKEEGADVPFPPFNCIALLHPVT